MARRVSTAGYRSAITKGSKVIAGTEVAQYLSKAAFVPFPQTPTTAADLPVRETPGYFDTQPTDWVSVTAYGAKADDGEDDTAAFQKALDAGKPVVYLPTGRYVISRTLHMKGGVRQIAGFGSTLTPGGTAFNDAAAPAALIEVDNGSAPDVTIGDLTVTRAPRNAPTSAGLIGFAHHTARPLVLKDIGCCGSYQAGYAAGPGAGPLYLDDVSASGWRFEQPQQVWARQLNNIDEVAGVGAGPATAPKATSARLVNAGATLWVLGFESEQSGPLVRTEHGGRTEILGGAVYEAASSGDVAFECLDDASMSLSFATMGSGNGVYRVLVRQRRGDASKDLARQQAVWRDEGRTVPLYTG
jgi:hypothetical protein